jgi:hypothetical protein
MMASLFEKVPALKNVWMDHLRDLDWIVLPFKMKIRMLSIVRLGLNL